MALGHDKHGLNHDRLPNAYHSLWFKRAQAQFGTHFRISAKILLLGA
jgi:hypothetical protein